MPRELACVSRSRARDVLVGRGFPEQLALQVVSCLPGHLARRIGDHGDELHPSDLLTEVRKLLEIPEVAERLAEYDRSTAGLLSLKPRLIPLDLTRNLVQLQTVANRIGR